MPTAAKKTAEVVAEQAPTPDAVEQTKPVLDPAFVKKHGLPDEYVAEVEAGLRPMPPSLGEDHDGSTELHFLGGSWVVTKTGVPPGETTAISR
jgi:hypothetical protein